ncbi:MAG: retropepsin-like domain-containing protein [Acidobacteriota bacterium]|nr:retropepsin-like domain-containing protein [Acidobacteriota bacterium]
MESLSFDEIHFYDTLKTGITVSVILKFGDEFVDFEAKIDTGSSFCIFERKHAERLEIDVESGEEIRISTATNYFSAYKHELRLSVMNIETVSTVYFAKEESFTRNVLGRQGFLDRVKLGLIDYEGKLLLSEYNQ